MDPPAPAWQRFFAELKRRKVFRVMAAYGIVGFVVLQAMDLAVPALLLPDWTYRLVAVLLLAGFPVAVVLAWAFEVGPEGVRRTAPATPGELDAIVAVPAARRWPSGLLALAGIAALLAGAWYAGRRSAPGSGERVAGPDAPHAPSIAVLPCRSVAADTGQEYLSDGIAEDLSNLLSRIRGLRVTSFRSSFAFKDRATLGSPAIADSLNVDHLLDCSVQKSGDRVRITAYLVEARTDVTIWNDSWDRTLTDVFAIQDEIAAEVVDQLQVQLLVPAPRAVRTDTLAYALLLQARKARRDWSPDALARSNELLRQAVRADPGYALAHAELAWNLVLQAGFGFVPRDEGYRRAREEAHRALANDPGLAVAHARLAMIEKADRADLEAAAAQLNQALELDPTDLQTLEEAGYLLVSLGRREEAIRVLRYVVARDPLSPRLSFKLGSSYNAAGRVQDAIAAYRRANRLADSTVVTRALGLALVVAGEPEPALPIILDMPDGGPRDHGLAVVYWALGRERESDEALDRLIACCERAYSFDIAWAFALRGDADAAFEWLEKAARYGDAGLTQIHGVRAFDALKDDPRWLPFLESLGLAPAQLERIELRLPPLE